jgi:hypothetical protein
MAALTFKSGLFHTNLTDLANKAHAINIHHLVGGVGKHTGMVVAVDVGAGVMSLYMARAATDVGVWDAIGDAGTSARAAITPS